MLILLLLLLPLAANAQSLTWQQQTNTGSTWPGATGYSTNLYDPVTQKVLIPSVGPSNGSIFVNSIYECSISPFLCSYASQSGDPTTTGCRVQTSTMFGNAHPYRLWAIDTLRSRLFLAGGPNDSCNGIGDNPRQQFYYFSLNGDPNNDTWSQQDIMSTGLPTGCIAEGAMTYDSTNDIYMCYGGEYHHWVFCPTNSLSANQTTAGCVTAKVWAEVSPSNGVVDLNGTAVTRVSGDSFDQVMKAGDQVFVRDGFYVIASITNGNSMTLATAPSGGPHSNQNWYLTPLARAGVTLFHDTASQQVIFYGAANNSGTATYNSIWGWSMLGKKWKHLALTGTQPTIDCIGTCNGDSVSNIGQSSVAFKQSTNQLFYHCVAGTACPQDWAYNTLTDAWTQLTASGTGPSLGRGAYMVFIPPCNCIVGYLAATGSGNEPQIWLGQITGGGVSIGGRSSFGGAVSF